MCLSDMPVGMDVAWHPPQGEFQRTSVAGEALQNRLSEQPAIEAAKPFRALRLPWGRVCPALSSEFPISDVPSFGARGAASSLKVRDITHNEGKMKTPVGLSH